MTKILATIGPASTGKNLKFFLDRADLLRLNTSHNVLGWHKQNIKKIKKLFLKETILHIWLM